jgi:S1-C subfamily serine protease
MEKSRVHCPKCRHEQDGQVECEACGLIFARYDRFQQKQKEQEEMLQTARQQQKTTGRLFPVALLMIVTASITYYFSRGKTEPEIPAPNAVEAPIATTRQVIPEVNTQPQPSRAATPIATAPSTASALEHARNATVSIQTPWGIGSGFFVKENYIVTNKHVVEINPEELKEFRNKVQTGRELMDLEKQKIREMHQKMNELSEGPSRKQLAIIIKHHEEEFAKNMPKFEGAEKRLKDLERDIQPEDIKIIMANGSEYTASYLMVSQNHDLALLSLSANNQTLLQRSGKTALQQGDKVYTIGSPVGLRNTLTAGVFSGYRKQESDGALLLQIDAPINPGNSGGPLIDEKGNVHGVNTMIMRDTEGIGFAIPIETVYEEFHSTLY